MILRKSPEISAENICEGVLFYKANQIDSATDANFRSWDFGRAVTDTHEAPLKIHHRTCLPSSFLGDH